VEIIVEHFRQHTAGKIGGQAKAMVMTASRLHAVRYKVAIDKYRHTNGYSDLKALVAFESARRRHPDRARLRVAGVAQLIEHFTGADQLAQATRPPPRQRPTAGHAVFLPRAAPARPGMAADPPLIRVSLSHQGSRRRIRDASAAPAAGF
jgi:hypothetical protein